MKKFKYRFDRLLDIREHQEKERQFEFSVVLNKYLRTKEIIDTSNDLSNQYLMDSRSKVESLDLDYIVMRDSSRRALKSRAKSYGNLLKEQKFEVEKKREKLVEASKKKKTLEILKEKDYGKYKKEVENVENYLLDEIGSNIYLKNNKSS